MTEDRVVDTWEVGDPYERFIGRWSRQVAPRFLQWLQIPVNQRWLDVGCGTGALSAAILRHTAPAAVTAVDPSQGFLARASEYLGGRVMTRVGSAAELPLDAGSIDVAVSGLVLNFTPDVVAALVEQARVTVAAGTVAAYVWDYAEGMELLRLFWDAAVELDGAARVLDEGARFAHCRPDALTGAFREAGLGGVAVTPIDIETRFVDFDDLWAPFLGGQGPAPSYVASLHDASRTALRDRVRKHIQTHTDGSITLRARAWAVRGYTRG